MAHNKLDGEDDPKYHMLNLAQNNDQTNVMMGPRKSIVTIQAFIRGWNHVVQEQKLSTKLSLAPFPAEAIKIEGLVSADDADVIEDDADNQPTQQEIISQLMTQLSIALPKTDNPNSRSV